MQSTKETRQNAAARHDGGGKRRRKGAPSRDSTALVTISPCYKAERMAEERILITVKTTCTGTRYLGLTRKDKGTRVECPESGRHGAGTSTVQYSSCPGTGTIKGQKGEVGAEVLWAVAISSTVCTFAVRCSPATVLQYYFLVSTRESIMKMVFSRSHQSR